MKKPRDIINEIAEAQGWNEGTQLELLIDFLNLQPIGVHIQLEVFLEKVAEEEDNFVEELDEE